MTPWVVGLVGTIQASCALAQISLLSAGNTSFYLGFRSELLITVIRAAAINNVLARPVCQCKINMVPGQAWTLRTTHGLYCIKLKHAETE